MEREIKRAGEQFPAVRAVLETDWIKVYKTYDYEFSRVFAQYADRLIANGKNEGECGVLAMGKIYGCELVIDDATPYAIAEKEGIRVTATVPLLCEAVRSKKLTLGMVEALADDLLEGEYFLPFGRGGFRQHVLMNGLLDYSDTQQP